LAGIFDFAHDMGLPHHDNGFGTTAGRYNVQPGPYLFIPLIGPTNFRDLLGYIADAVTDPLAFQPFHDGQVIYARALVDGLDQRARADDQLKAIDDMSTDAYASLRSLFEQNRTGQIADAVAGASGTAQPQLDEFNDPGAANPAAANPAAPVPPPPPGAPEPAAKPVAAIAPGGAIDRMVDALLDKPLAPMTPDLSSGALVPVESPQAG
jgi:phospholipid-binding lipoprotein MlaA